MICAELALKISICLYLLKYNYLILSVEIIYKIKQLSIAASNYPLKNDR